MRPVSNRTLLVSAARVGILMLAIASLAVAQPQRGPLPATSPALTQALNDSSAAMRRKDYAAAREAALKATAIDPRNQSAWFNVGFASGALGDLPQAETAYKTLIAINPTHTNAYNNLGVVYQKMGRHQEAIESYRKQMEVAPRSRLASYNLSRALASEGKWEEARPFAAMAVDIVPDEVNRWVFLGKIQTKTGHIDEARTSFLRALSLPHAAAIENDIAYELADAGADLDKSWQLISGALAPVTRVLCQPESLSDADKCTAQLRQIAFMLDTAGWIQYRQGNTKAAEPYLRSSFAITPRGANELHMVVVLAKTGRLEEAVTLFTIARSRPNFSRWDSQEAVRELAKAAGGEVELDALLQRHPLPLSPATDVEKVLALVDGDGKVIDAQAVTPASPGLADVAKSMALPALSWPDHSVRSIRTIEFERSGDQWLPSVSYVGVTPPPPPCGSTPPPVITTMLRQESITSAAATNCPGAY